MRSRDFIYLKRFIGGILKLILWALDGIIRLLYLLLPLGLHMLLMQLRTKMSNASAISAYITPKSEFQFVYSGTILVMVDPNSVKTNYANIKAKATAYFERNKIWLLVWITLIVTALGIKYLT